MKKLQILFKKEIKSKILDKLKGKSFLKLAYEFENKRFDKIVRSIDSYSECSSEDLAEENLDINEVMDLQSHNTEMKRVILPKQLLTIKYADKRLLEKLESYQHLADISDHVKRDLKQHIQKLKEEYVKINLRKRKRSI